MGKKSNPSSTVNSSESGGTGNVTLTHVSSNHHSMSNHGVKPGLGIGGVGGGGSAFIHSENHHHNSSPSNNSSSLHSNNVVNSSNNRQHSSSMAPAHLHPSHRIVSSSAASSRNSSIHETSSSNHHHLHHQRVNHGSSSAPHHNNHHNHHNPGSGAKIGDGGRGEIGANGEDGLECGIGHSAAEEWDDYPSDALLDTGEPGIPVRALYDYEGAEADELSFKQGSFLPSFISSPRSFVHILSSFLPSSFPFLFTTSFSYLRYFLSLFHYSFIPS